MTCQCCIVPRKRAKSVQCGRPAAFGFRWGGESAGVCCASCRETLQAAALRCEIGVAHFWPLELPAPGDTIPQL